MQSRHEIRYEEGAKTTSIRPCWLLANDGARKTDEKLCILRVRDYYRKPFERKRTRDEEKRIRSVLRALLRSSPFVSQDETRTPQKTDENTKKKTKSSSKRSTPAAVLRRFNICRRLPSLKRHIIVRAQTFAIRFNITRTVQNENVKRRRSPYVRTPPHRLLNSTDRYYAV